jgi:hypothetical protein
VQKGSSHDLSSYKATLCVGSLAVPSRQSTHLYNIPPLVAEQAVNVVLKIGSLAQFQRNHRFKGRFKPTANMHPMDIHLIRVLCYNHDRIILRQASRTAQRDATEKLGLKLARWLQCLPPRSTGLNHTILSTTTTSSHHFICGMGVKISYGKKALSSCT